MKIIASLFALLVIVLLAAALIFLPSVVIYYVYNDLVAPAFKWPHVSFWVCFGVLWICRILFTNPSSKS